MMNPLPDRTTPRNAPTRREREILARTAMGQTPKEIAGELGISVWTVRKHHHNVMEKLGLSTQLELAVWWIRQEESDENRRLRAEIEMLKKCLMEMERQRDQWKARAPLSSFFVPGDHACSS